MPSTSILDSLAPVPPTLGMTATQPPPVAPAQASQDQGPAPDLTVTVKAKRPAANTSVLDSLQPVAPTMGMQAANPDEASSWSDLAQQVWGGIKQNIVGMGNLPAQMVGGAGPAVDQAAAGIKPMAAQPLFPGGFPAPQVPPAKDFAGRAANTVGQFLPSALLGAAGAESIPAAIGGVAKQVLPTVAAGVGAQAGQELAPPGYGDVWQLLGATVGAGGAALGQAGIAGGARAIGNQVGQMGFGPKQNIGGVNVTGSQAQNAAAQVGNALGPAGVAKLTTQRPLTDEIVPGSQPTTAQVAPTPGALALEKAHRVATPEPFIAREQEQNQARVAAIEGVQPTGNPAAVGEHVVQLLDNAQNQGNATAQTALGRLQAASAALGGEQPTEVYGGQIRGALQGALKPVHAATQQLWDAVDPEGTWALPVGGLPKTAQSLLNDISPTGKTDPTELALLQRAAGLNGVVPFRDLSQIREDINEVKRTIDPGMLSSRRRLDILKSSLDQTIVDGADARAQTEENAVQSGQMAPEATITNRIGAFGSGGRSTGSAEQTAGGGAARVPSAGGTQGAGSGGLGGRQGNSQVAAEAADEQQWARIEAEIAAKQQEADKLAAAGKPVKMANPRYPHLMQLVSPDMSEPGKWRMTTFYEGQPAGHITLDTPQEAFRLAYREGNVPIGAKAAPIEAAPAERIRKPESLADFLIARGGVRDPGGDLKAPGADAIHHQKGGRLLNPRGVAPDYAREAAVEAGFLRPGADINDLYDAISEEASGRPVYREGDQGAGQFWASNRAEGAKDADVQYQARDAAAVAAERAGVRLSKQEIAAAAEAIAGGADPHAAIYDAVRSTEEAELERNTRMQGVGQLGVPPGAQQAEMPLRSQRIANFNPQAAAAYKAANAATREEKQRFGQGGVGKILKAGKNFQEFAVPEGKVPAQILTGGPTELEEVNRLFNAVGNKDIAHNLTAQALANDLHTKGIIGPEGTVNAGRYATWLNKHKDTFGAYPDIAAKFGDVATAQGTYDKALADQKEGLAAFNKTAAARFIGADPHKAVAAAFSGTNPMEAMRSLVNAVKGNAEAEAGLKRAVVDNILEMSRSAAPSGETTDFLKAATFRNWVRRNGAPLKILFGGQGLQNLEAVAADLRRQAYKSTATAGSDTAANIAAARKFGLKEHAMHGTVLAIVGEQLGELASHALGSESGMLGAAIGAGSAIGGYLLHSLRQAGIRTTNDLVREAMLHPQVARELLQKLPAGKTSIGPLLARRIAATLQGLTAHELAKSEQTQ